VKIYQVGGAVRDKFLGLPVQDRDWVVVGATPEMMLTQGYQPVGKDFPVFLHPQTHEEYALARTERKTAPGYTGFAFHADPSVTLEEDLLRRDLTINAMALDEHGTLIDPYHGQRDLQQKILRHVSPAFVEDPVRILRLARFAARFAPLGFTIADETIALMRTMVANGEVDALVPERVWAECQRALGEAQPSAFITTLRECGALKKLMSEIDALFGVPQTAHHHPEIDTGIHTLMVIDQAARLWHDPIIVCAGLLHDLGKGITPKEELPQHIAHETRGLPLIRQFCQRLRVPNDYRDLALIAGQYHLHSHRAAELRADTIVDLLQKTDAFRRPDRFEQFLRTCEADSRGRGGRENSPYPQADLLRQALAAAQAVDTAAITAQELIGPAIADAIRQARIKAVTANKQNLL
jgi:tRNA nucleotidyltransferase (CCA-adding enzyme)